MIEKGILIGFTVFHNGLQKLTTYTGEDIQEVYTYNSFVFHHYLTPSTLLQYVRSTNSIESLKTSTFFQNAVPHTVLSI